MDKIIKKKKWTPKKIVILVAGTALILFVLYSLIFGDKSSKLNVQTDRITIETVSRGPLQDYNNFTGNVIPIRTVYLDAMEGGRVEDILVEEGTLVEKGDVLLKLSNTNLHLSIMNREAELADQMNNLRSTRLLMEQNMLDLRKQALDTNYLLSEEKRNYLQKKKLYDNDFISEEEFLETKNKYEYYQEKTALVAETAKQDSLFRSVQILQLEDSVVRMQENLKIVREKLDNLNVKAPVSGELATLNADYGESIPQGRRLGHVNVLDSYKIEAEIDEHYISRVRKGLEATFEFGGIEYTLKVNKIYTLVTNGRFNIDLTFTNGTPPTLRIGQSFRVKLELGEPREAILLPRGGFFQATGGQWVFVVDATGKIAEKRDIRLGSMNPQYYEVLEGLQPGDRVVISNYDNFGKAEKLILKTN